MLRTLLVVLRINAIGYLIVYENILRQSIKFPLYRNLSHINYLISQQCCDSENESLNMRVKNTVAVV